ncbi:MAG: hypothetical protein AAGM22_22050 [Acidobacteriota bacterium]
MTDAPASHDVPLNVVTALPSEARPLVDAYDLRTEERHGLRIASGPGVRVAVVGIGRLAMASGVGFLAGAFPGPAIWLNVGIAGHGRYGVGEVLMAHAVEDRATGKSFYPPLVVAPPVPTGRVVTVDEPETTYGEDAAFDMEAAAFLAAARRFQTAELAHVLKVVSDGPDSPIASINRERVAGWIKAALPAIEALRRSLTPVADAHLALQGRPSGEAELLGRWHFTTSDRRALRRELVRGRALGFNLETVDFAGARRGRDVVATLRRHLDTLAIGERP